MKPAWGQAGSRLPLYAQVASRLVNGIRLGALPENEPLPSERQLADAWEVSRVTARRAIAQLVRQGLVLPRRGSGNYVAAGAARLAQQVQPEGQAGSETSALPWAWSAQGWQDALGEPEALDPASSALEAGLRAMLVPATASWHLHAAAQRRSKSALLATEWLWAQWPASGAGPVLKSAHELQAKALSSGWSEQRTVQAVGAQPEWRAFWPFPAEEAVLCFERRFLAEGEVKALLLLLCTNAAAACLIL